MATTEPGQALAASYFYVQFTGLEVVAFREVSGFGSQNTVIVEHQVNSQGRASYVKVPGPLSWEDLVLKKGVDSGMALWTWRDEIMTKGVDGQRKDGQIFIVDVEGKPQTTWKVVGAWPCNYVVGAMVPDSSEMLLEEVHIAHEGMERVK